MNGFPHIIVPTKEEIETVLKDIGGSMVGQPSFVGEFPSRQDITVLPAIVPAPAGDVPDRVELGWSIQEHIGMAVVNPRSVWGTRYYTLPKKWVRKALRGLKMDSKVRKEILHLCKKIKNKMEIFEDVPWNKEMAIKICRAYLKVTNRKEWPLLIGMNSVMDEVLGEMCKRGRP